MPRLLALFALLAVAGGGLVARSTSWRSLEPQAAEAAPASPLVRSPVPSLAPRAVPAPDRIRTPIPRAVTADERLAAERRTLEEAIVWRSSRALGTPSAGRLEDGVLLPLEGVDFFTWDPVRWASPSPPERRHGTDRLVRTLLDVLSAHRVANPGAARVGVGDLSRPHGGRFDASFGIVGEFGTGRGGLGHVSHQNGLDVDVYYPRRDRRERAPDSLEDIDLLLAQDLVQRFVAAGAQFVFVGPRTGLGGPAGVVQPLTRHDDHLHLRLPPG